MPNQGGLFSGGADGYDGASILGDSRYRRILSILLERSQPMSSRDLSVQIAAQEAGVPPAEIPEATRESVRTALAHQYLPKLQGVGWVDRTPAGLTGTAPQLTQPDALSLPPLDEPEHPHWDPLSTLLSRPYRIVLVAFLADQHRPLSLAQLATHLREYEQLSWVSSLPDGQHLHTQLYHVDVPKLADVGLLAFDSAAQTVTHTALTSDIVEQPASILE